MKRNSKTKKTKLGERDVAFREDSNTLSKTCNVHDACKRCQKNIDKLIDKLLQAENDLQVGLKNNEYIRSTQIVEAPEGKEGKAIHIQYDDNSHDLHVFLPRNAFTMLKCGLDEKSDALLITLKYTLESWKERLAL